MKILVIEDKAIHQESARETLIGHEVTVVPSYNEAYGLLKWKKEFDFDAVLTDMNMPMSERNLSSRIIFRPDEQVPYGFILALAAAYRGAKYVALVTDINHHYGAMSAALDLLAPEYYDYRNKCMGDREKRFYINGARVIFVHAPFVVNIIKDQPCDLCTENPGVCTYCQGSGKRTWETTIETCNVCNGAKKCQDCKGTLRKDKKMHCECKDWGRVLRDLLEE